ncbi:bifunctional ADP-dependent NAD(P)H-hydrate dehydratase/NAD(P)H-hydrate epimerase [Cellulomonas fimi]|uniref:Bifunctional NAD(P)H-hydrate repair enzyme n=1 Tax=Cellulomonas fimi TaxID=1708 RepID=A0A7Y0QGB4_CELFI|nr:bifunctional ADP-dependent NAD(P)H-hydrate dehydratase/NAD(P)H-hydrate epimerase [Cellulomonas fimi]NMR18918.1 bifunctional ADP-dependent (S)-NAD(P)H-hydrate dehydratase/NAD(P)H-hydrate epimerase [Cellulomonas fimi]
MILGYTAAQVRAAEQPLLESGPAGALMERAAFALAVRVGRLLRERRGRVRGSAVVLLVGPGNNGGDALHAGAELARRGARVLAVLTSTRAHDAGLAALVAAGGRVVTVVGEDGVPPAGAGGAEPVWLGDAIAEASACDVVLDGLLGIGARGGLRGEAAELVLLLAELLADDAPGGPAVVAVDTPSGVGVDDGAVAGPLLPADLTVTFGAAKAGLLLPPASGVVGQVEVVDLGLDLVGRTPAVARLERDDVAALWPVPGASAQKYSRGVLGVVAGTAAYPGAGVLTVSGAVRGGAGMVRYLGPPGVTAAVLSARPEVVAGEGRVQAWALGPGVDPHDRVQADRVRDVLGEALVQGLPVVVDAGGLSLLPGRVPPWVVLTPHAGELADLVSVRTDEEVGRAAVEAEPLRWARRARELTGATVLLKGPTTVVVGVHDAVYAQADGPAWLATAGSGDVLTGLLGALLAGRAADVLEDPTLAAALAAAAALVHGRAAERAQPGGPVSALAVADALPAEVAAVLDGRGAR